MPPMIIRPYTHTDLAPVTQLFTRSVHMLAAGHYDAVEIAAWAPQPPDLHAWNERLAALHTLVAEDAGVLVGFIAYELNGHIDLLYTSPTHNRRGIATALYSQVESTLISIGIESVFTEASLVARPFFERHGFRVTAQETVVRRGVAFERFVMRKVIQKPS